MNRSKPEEIKRTYPAPRARTIVKHAGIRAEEAKTSYQRSNSRSNSRSIASTDPNEQLKKEINILKQREDEFREMVITLQDTVESQSRIIEIQKSEIDRIKQSMVQIAEVPRQRQSDYTQQLQLALQMSQMENPTPRMNDIQSIAYQTGEDPMMVAEMQMQERMLQHYERQHTQELQESDPYGEMTYEQLLELEEQMGTVNVGMSESDIAKIRSFPYTHPAKMSCTICQSDVTRGEKVKKLPKCGHMYHEGCIVEWLKQKKVCPVCMKDV